MKETNESKVIYDSVDVDFAEAGVIQNPTFMGIVRVVFTLPTIMLCALYFVTFGGELAINSNLSSFYIEASGKPPWSQTYAANWAAMYGLLNVVTRPMGGLIGDWLYPVAGVEGKKFWLITCKFVRYSHLILRRRHPGDYLGLHWLRSPYQHSFIDCCGCDICHFYRHSPTLAH